MGFLRISELADRARVPVSTIRYYERIGIRRRLAVRIDDVGSDGELCELDWECVRLDDGEIVHQPALS